MTGNWEDKAAWDGLSGLMSHEEVVRFVNAERAKNWHRNNPNPSKNPETAKKIGNALRGVKKSDEAKANMSKSAKNKPAISDETRTKHRAERKRRYANGWVHNKPTLGTKIYNNGLVEKRFREGQTIPVDFIKGRLVKHSVTRLGPQ